MAALLVGPDGFRLREWIRFGAIIYDIRLELGVALFQSVSSSVCWIWMSLNSIFHLNATFFFLHPSIRVFVWIWRKRVFESLVEIFKWLRDEPAAFGKGEFFISAVHKLSGSRAMVLYGRFDRWKWISGWRGRVRLCNGLKWNLWGTVGNERLRLWVRILNRLCNIKLRKKHVKS